MNFEYKSIVDKWYRKLRMPCLNLISQKYPVISIQDAEDIYQETFIAVYENIQKDRVKEGTSWNSYIMHICLNKAAKCVGKLGNVSHIGTVYDPEDPDSWTMTKVDKIISGMTDEEKSIYESAEAKALLGEKLLQMPELCKSIISDYYYGDMSMTEIATVNNLKNADVAKSKKSQCMKTLAEKLKTALKSIGFFN